MKNKKADNSEGRRRALKIIGAGALAGTFGLWNTASANEPEALRDTFAKRSPLKVHENWYYFSDESGNPLVLTGSHTWGRKRKDKMWVSDGWDLAKFEKYLDFIQHWNHNYIRLWMWEQEGTIDIWSKNSDGKYDLGKLNDEYFQLTRSFVEAARNRNIYLGVMLFQGWSGTCEASAPDWPRHPMHPDNNVNGINGAEEGATFGNRVHTLEDPRIVNFQETYVRRMIDTLNEFDNILWETGNETIRRSIPWMAHMVKFIRGYESTKPKQHLILTGTGNGVGNDSIHETGADTFSPCVVTGWGRLDDPYIGSPPIPDGKLRKPIILDNDHLGNHFLRHTALDQRSWTWKAFTRGNHPIHMDCYDVFWDNESPKMDHPIAGVNTHPHYDPQRKSLGDVRIMAAKMNLALTTPIDDPLVCSTTYCLVNEGRQYLAYQPLAHSAITLRLPAGHFRAEFFDPVTGKLVTSDFSWNGGRQNFPPPAHAAEDWVLFVTAI